MIATLTLALVLAQARTVEDRIQEISKRIEVLDAKAAELARENQGLRLKVEEARVRREGWARQAATAWVRRYAGAVPFTEPQVSDLEALWTGWSKSDLEKPCEVAQWKAREEILRGKLTAEQVRKLADKVREEQKGNVTTSLSTIVQMAKLPADRAAKLEKVVLPRVTYGDGVLLPMAHPDHRNLWPDLLAIVEKALPDLAATLTEAELSSVRTLLERLKPRTK